MQLQVAPSAGRLPRMSEARNYDEWKSAALAHDERTGAAQWRGVDESRRYDYRVIRYRLDEIRAVKASGDPHQVLYYLNEGIHGNMGGMGSRNLYKRAKFGTKDLVTEYIGELSGALDLVADVDDNTIS